MIPIKSSSKHSEEFAREGPYHQPEYIVIHVRDPVTAYDENAKPYTSYEIRTETTFPYYKGKEFIVRRRYSEFINLLRVCEKRVAEQDSARKHGPLPALPGDTMGSLFGLGNGKFDPVFVEQRRKDLEVFLNALANHTLARFEPELHQFLMTQKHVITAPKGWF